ncbi:probable pancreatic secretory proteinase inhibitor [Athalia rosae]|uniref:probable pancreatic secretory proteinase inhibitor n=1 Tax=Athalia rosae TaxID=37344 RepID=UPI000625CE90|nr:probable pancreatic secretory proteinase inhibitor [Athalia rosae]XP_048506627.1 probable pancreatic secretory proteinase inhibitor [Athalia rosae]
MNSSFKLSFLPIALLILLCALNYSNSEWIQPMNRQQPACVCTMDYTPVCASNGLTYPNLCAFKCAQREAVAKGHAADLRVVRDDQC